MEKSKILKKDINPEDLIKEAEKTVRKEGVEKTTAEVETAEKTDDFSTANIVKEDQKKEENKKTPIDPEKTTGRTFQQEMEFHKLNNPKAYTIHRLVELFSTSESGQKAKGREKLLNYCMRLITFLTAALFGFIFCEGMGWLELEGGAFIGTIGAIAAAITGILTTISKYLYNNDKDEILSTIKEVVKNID